MRLFLLVTLTISLAFSVQAQNNQEARDAFVKAQNEYLAQLSLDFFQNKEYQILTRNYDKMEMKVNLTDMPKSLQNKKIKKLRKEKDEKMKKLLNPQQFKLYIRRQKVIEKTISTDW
jgi:hypothetical protein